LDCPCCTTCCSDKVSGCNNEEWYGELDPVWQYKYARRAYSFNEAKVIFPIVESAPGIDDPTEYIFAPDLGGLYSTLPDDSTVPDAEFVTDGDRVPSDTYQYGSP
jgi:hypothetical protein